MMRVNYLDDRSTIYVRGRHLINRAELRQALTGFVPALVASAAIVTLAAGRLLFSLEGQQVANHRLAVAGATARFPLEARDIASMRSARAEALTYRLSTLRGQPLRVLGPLVAITNGVPSELRIKALAATTTGVAITSAEALSFEAIYRGRQRLQAAKFDAVISSVAAPTDGSSWTWVGQIALTAPTNPTTVTEPRELTAPLRAVPRVEGT